MTIKGLRNRESTAAKPSRWTIPKPAYLYFFGLPAYWISIIIYITYVKPLSNGAIILLLGGGTLVLGLFAFIWWVATHKRMKHREEEYAEIFAPQQREKA